MGFRIGPSPGVTEVHKTKAGGPNSFANFEISFSEQFQFPGEQIEIKEKLQEQALPTERPFYRILLKLFVEILESQIEIVPTKPVDTGKFAVEAYFIPPVKSGSRPAIHLPLPIQALGKESLKPSSNFGNKLSAASHAKVEKYVEIIVSNFSDEQLLRLIIVAAHEFGHFKSFAIGNHTESFKKGLYLFQKKYLNTPNASEFTWLVFREECQAWHYAEAFLRKVEFSFWDTYEAVKSSSLQTYYKNLKLEEASLETYISMSFLGDDFKKNSTSVLFR